ncbi:MAG: M28 family peptidase [Rhodanobacteraceae bacterium]|nr:M28 family peptidase [Xanthomonadales bacterium]MCP5479596.1 M28 family peptidase [Rhodanobacteraceae bacterium]
MVQFSRVAPRLIIALLLASGLAACQKGEDAATAPAAGEAPASVNDAATDTASPAHSFGPEISAEDFAQHVKVLSSDEFGGRSPGGKFEELTINYLKAQFERLGLQPGNGDSYLQEVPAVGMQAATDTTMTLTVDGKAETLKQGEDMVLVSTQGKPEINVADSELVFVGYGINAPEAGWNDYAGIDVKGKTVVILVNDPGFASQDPSLFQGKRMTYYGRWTYKYEEAARQGAAAALIIHQTDAAGYGWDVVRNSWTGQEFHLPASVDPAPRLPLSGWLTGESAKHLFERSGLDLAKLQAEAGKPGFKAVPMAATLSADLHSTITEAKSHNVMALLPGTEHPDEAIIYMAHWDHLGTQPDYEGDDKIFNGAVDNATGVAGVLEIAERFVTEAKPKRSVLFMLVTLEESGLLGSGYYVQNPVIPLKDTVAVINLDAMSVVGRAKDMVVIGYGNSELEDILKPAAAFQGRELHAESAPERGYFFRSDHFNFAKAGVPALYTKSGLDMRDGGEAAGEAELNDYTKNRYHSPRDEFDPNWDLGGVVEDLNVLDHVGRQLANSDQWPNWYEGNAFKATRDAQRAAASD